jgi:hypothetical protein
MVDRRGLLHLPLVRLRPGTYHIELQASNVIDKFVGEPYEWIVNVNEPWWRTTGVLAAMVGVLLLLLAVNLVFYIRNTRLREKRNNDESSMVRRIENFVERCTKYEQETLAPSLDELYAGTESQSAVLSPTFVQIMMTVLPYIKEQKNGEGPAPVKTSKGWLHLAHGVRGCASGLRYVLYMYMTALDDPTRVIAEPAGFFMAPEGEEYVGDVANVLFTNGWIADPDGKVFIYYASCDTRLHVATSTVDRLVDYCMGTEPDGMRTGKTVERLCSLIDRNLSILRK